MNRTAVIAVFTLSLSLSLTAQAPQQAAAPGVTPQHQLMGYFAGDWTAAGTSRISPKTPAAPFSLKEHGEWVTDGYFLETRTSMKSTLGTVNSQRVMGYNVQDKVYTYNVYNSLGEHQVALGHVNGNTWTWESEEKLNGLVIKGRYTIVETSPNSYTFKSEVADPKGGWATVMEGTATRVTAAGN
jgi:hypothetical protein